MMVFGSPFFLWGALLAAGPLVIHLARRRHALPLRFSTLRFLSVSGPPRQRQRQPQDLLLLALRTLLILVIVFVLAQPRWVPPSETAPRNAVVFLFDTSASMAWQGRDEALAAALSAELDLRPAAAFGRVVYDVEARAVDAVGAIDASDLRKTLADFPPRSVAIDPAAALLTAYNQLPDGGTVVVVTDAQAGQWEYHALPSSPPGVQLTWLRLDTFPENPRLIHTRVITGTDGQRLLSARAQGSEKAELRLEGPDGERLGRVAFGASDDGVAAASLELPPQLPAWAIATLILPEGGPDGLTADNSQVVWLAPPPPVTVTIWLPELDEGEKQREAGFVARALGVPPRDGGVRFAVELGGAEADEGDGVWFLAGAADEAPEAVFATLAERLAAGGSLVVTPGRNPARLFRYLRETRLLPVRYRGRRERSVFAADPYQVGSLPAASPLRNVFDAESERGLHLSVIRRYDQLELPEDTDARVWLATEEGHPLLLEASVGEGRLFVFTLGLETASADLPVGSAFLPLIREVFSAAAPPVAQVRELNLGQAVRRSPELPPERVFELTAWPEASPPALFRLPPVESTPRAVAASALITAGRERSVGPPPPPLASAEIPLEPWLLGLALAAFLAEALLSQPRKPARTP